MAIFERSPKPAFSEKVQRGDQEKFFKNHPESSLRLKSPKALWRKQHYPQTRMHLKRLQKCLKSKLRQFSHAHPKPAFSEKVQRGDQDKFLKNRPKSSPRLKGLKALWRKQHYPQTRMHLKCKDLKRFRRKQRLQKCPNGEVMAIFARSLKTRIF